MKKLVFVVDMINGFCKEGALADSKILHIVDSIKEEINKTDKENLYFVCDCHDPAAVEFEVFPPHCLAGSKESEVIDELKEYVCEDRLIRKNSVNTFLAINNPESIFTSEVEEVLITGCCTDICIQNFAITFKHYCNQNNLSIKVVVDMNMVETFDSPTHAAIEYRQSAINQLKANGVVVVNE